MKAHTPSILIVDDELNIRRSLELILRGEGFSVTCVGSAEEALAHVQGHDVDAVFLDVQLPGLDGIAALRTLRAARPQLAVVMISGHATVERAVEATRLGAFDFLEKPFARERILLLARNAAESTRLRAQNAELRQQPADDLLGESPAMAALREAIARVAVTDARVLILGESGTGKELVARALHRGSSRAGAPFLKVNCAAIPDELIEGELFGAMKGAYTGAVADRQGRFAAADGGTLLLDEIGEMSLRAQAKVLRVLQEGELEPVGSTQTLKVDVRVLAATHQDLGALVERGRFREDLFFRLNVVPLRVPSLRERAGDVPLLVERFLQGFGARHDRPGRTVSPTAMKLLAAYAWPGNVRELINLVERLVILAPGEVIGPPDLPAELREALIDDASCAAAGDGRYAHLSLRDAKEALERDLIRGALARHAGNVTRAAADLGLERTHLHKRIRALGLRIPGPADTP